MRRVGVLLFSRGLCTRWGWVWNKVWYCFDIVFFSLVYLIVLFLCQTSERRGADHFYFFFGEGRGAILYFQYKVEGGRGREQQEQQIVAACMAKAYYAPWGPLVLMIL